MNDREPIYAVYPGEMRSKNDGQWHFINAGQLCRLYGVWMGDCVVIREEDYSDLSKRGKIARAEKLIALYPRYDGNYTLPTK